VTLDVIRELLWHADLRKMLAAQEANLDSRAFGGHEIAQERPNGAEPPDGPDDRPTR